MNKILLLEDDPALAKSLMSYLGSHGYTIDWAKHGEEAVEYSYDTSYDLYLFDINVPLLNGIDLLSLLRHAEDRTPTIFISAQIDIDSVTKGFRAGADDYIKKPFDLEELLVRIQAKTASLEEYITVHSYRLNRKNSDITYNDEMVSMGEVQKRLLTELLIHYPNVVPKDVLMNALDKPTDLALRVNMAKLKKNIALEVVSVRGVGYKII